MICYNKSFVMCDFTLYEDSIFYKFKKGASLIDILKESGEKGGGRMYNRTKKAIEKINKNLLDLDFINIDERYFQLKHRNSRRLYKLYLYLNRRDITYTDMKLVNLPLLKYRSENMRAYKSVFDELNKVFNLNCSFLDNMLVICHNIDDLLSHVQKIFKKRFNTHTVVNLEHQRQIDKLLNIYTLDKLKTYYTYYIFNKNSLNFTSFPISKFIKNIESISSAAERALQNSEECHFLWVDDLYNIVAYLWQRYGKSGTYGTKHDTFMLAKEPEIVNGHLYLICNFYASDLGVVYLDRAESNMNVLSILLEEYKQLKNESAVCQ